MTDQAELLDHVAQTLFDKKGANIIGLDLREVSQMTDFFVIAEGTVDRHVRALAELVIDACEKHGVRPCRIEGLETGDWVVIDFGNLMVHLFIPEMREKYALEELWHEGKIIDLKIVLP